jgi:formylglycine-generating enzyme required for sulfatase activity/serine/threonine protein kinase
MNVMKERTIFLEALEQPTPQRREAFLQQICGNDTALRHKVDGLLRAHVDAGSFLEHSPVDELTERPNDTLTKRGAGPTELPTQFGRYRVKRKLGGGGMGTVYLVENTELEREEALKVPHFSDGDDPQVRERFLREAKSAARLDHANLCPVYDAGVLDGIYYLTMRFLKGKPLSDYTGKPQPARKAVEIVAKLALALEAAHAKGVIHRDLKPGNVMMVSGSGPVVMDFGLAKQVRQPDRKLTQDGSMLGTPAYMPPEQLQGELDRMGPASDVYSLGVILYELLTGRLPFDGTMAMICGQILYSEPPLPSAFVPGLSPALDGICRQAMAKAPAERYPSMKAFAAALLDYLRSAPATEGAYNLLSANVDKAAVSQPVSVALGTQPAEGSGLFQVAPEVRRSLPPAPREAQAPPVTLPSRPAPKTIQKAGTTGEEGKRRAGGVVVSVAFGLLAIILGFWAVVVFRVSTAEGVLIVQVNEPDAELFVDGERVTVTWQNGGLKAEVGVKPGTRKVELKKDGFCAYGQEVLLEDRGRTVLVARLEPNPSTTPPQPDPAVDLSQQQDPRSAVDGASPAVVAGGSTPPGKPTPTPPGDRARPMRNPFQEAANPVGSAPKPIPGNPPPATRTVAGVGPQPLDCSGPNGASTDDVRRAQEAWAKYLGREVETNVEIANGVTMSFVLVPPGTFLMGSPPDERGKNGRYPNETLHEVTLTEPFDLGKYEVTQAQYAALTGKQPSRYKGSDRPVEQVTWDDADAFGRELTKKLSDGHVYRLATEAEWEYSCRGGRPSSQPFGVGDGRSLMSSDANFNNLVGETSNAGSYAANSLGLYDMHGNVWEWCADWNEPYPDGPVTNPLRLVGGPYRVARGGCHNEPAPECRSALRQGSPVGRRDCWMGFRLARSLPPPGISTAESTEIPNAANEEVPHEPVPADAVPPSPTTVGSLVASDEGSRAGDVRDDNALKLKLRWCPPGTFRMGSPKNEPDRGNNEGPVKVTLSRGFWLGQFEVTQSQWQSIMGTTQGVDQRNGEGPDHPMYHVSFTEAEEFCRKFTESEHGARRLPSGWEYRLPTEAQWEYACRAGTKTATAFGDRLSSVNANFVGSAPYNGAAAGPFRDATAPVGQYRPNAWGFYDMHGNVWEWCRDGTAGLSFVDHMEPLQGGVDPLGPAAAPGRVMRGGSWRIPGRDLRSAFRLPRPRDFRYCDLGFRVARVPSEEP